MRQPIKRHISLVPLSHDHHHGLLLCWKIRIGNKKGISPKRIYSYANYFFTSQLRAHFHLEEEHIFSLLGSENPLVKQAMQEHDVLKIYFTNGEVSKERLEKMADLLEQHIRFEERLLFTEIQNCTSNEVMMNIRILENKIESPDPEEWKDKFWLKGMA